MAASRPAAKSEWATPSHRAVFIRNLKLLQLDRREDWPGVTVRTLSPSPQNQRQRIRVVEWALYYLFTIWDPEGAQNVPIFQWPSLMGPIANTTIEITAILPPVGGFDVREPPSGIVPLSDGMEEA